MTSLRNLTFLLVCREGFWIFFLCNKISCNLSLCCIADGLVRRFIRGEEGVTFDRPSPAYDQKDFVPIEVKAGSLVVIHGDLIHQRSVTLFLLIFWAIHVICLLFWIVWKVSFCLFPLKYLDYSFENQSSKSRHVYSLHVVDTDGCEWAQDNW